MTYGTESASTGMEEPKNRRDMTFSEHPLQGHVRSNLLWRSEWNSLQRGRNVPLLSTKEAFVYLRALESELVVISYNQGDQPINIDLPSELVDAVGVRFSDRQKVVLRQFTAAPGMSMIGVRGDFASLYESALHTMSREVRFVVDSAEHLDFRIVGTAPELGAWNPSIAPSAKSMVSLPVGSTVSVKVVAMQDGKARWSKRNNQYVFVEAGNTPLQVHVVWQE